MHNHTPTTHGVQLTSFEASFVFNFDPADWKEKKNDMKR